MDGTCDEARRANRVLWTLAILVSHSIRLDSRFIFVACLLYLINGSHLSRFLNIWAQDVVSRCLTLVDSHHGLGSFFGDMSTYRCLNLRLMDDSMAIRNYFSTDRSHFQGISEPKLSCLLLFNNLPLPLPVLIIVSDHVIFQQILCL